MPFVYHYDHESAPPIASEEAFRSLVKVARDYILEHWEPERTAPVHVTSCNAPADTILRELLPCYQCTNEGCNTPRSTTPLFTVHQIEILTRIGLFLTWTNRAMTGRVPNLTTDDLTLTNYQ